MNKLILVAAMTSALFAGSATAFDRDSGVGPLIAAQGNAALLVIREQARANVLAQRPALPPRAAAEFAALRGGPVLPTTWRCAK